MKTLFERLSSEYAKHGGIVVGYDFDGTVFDYHGNCGQEYINRVHSVIKGLRDNGIANKFVCWTAAEDLDMVEQYLIENDLPFDSINGDGIDLGFTRRKPFFSVLIDDRAGINEVLDVLELLIIKYNVNVK